MKKSFEENLKNYLNEIKMSNYQILLGGPGGIPKEEIKVFNDKVSSKQIRLKKQLDDTTNRIDAAIDYILGISSVGWEFLGCAFIILSAIVQSSKSIKST